VVDARGQVYFVHGERSRILRVDAMGKLTTFLQGEEGKKLSAPHHLVLDKEGNLYSVGDRDGGVWKITPEGKSTQVYPPVDWVGIGFVGSGGNPFTLDADGNLICIHYRPSKHSQVLKVGPDGRLASLAGGDWGYADGKGTQARFRDLHGAAFAWAADGSLLVTDNGTSIRRITTDGTVTTLAGGREGGFADGPGKEARFQGAKGLAVDARGNVFVADAGNRRIRKITPDGMVSTVAGSGKRGAEDGAALKATFLGPAGVAVGRDGTLHVLDYYRDDPRLRRISPDGKVTTIASAVPAPTDAEVREWIQRLEQKKDLPARLQALKSLQNHYIMKNTALAIPVLDRTVRDDPVSTVRAEAVLALAHIARNQELPCPLVVVQAIFDQDEYVRQNAGAVAVQFTTFTPGTLELALRAAWSEDTNIRDDGLNLLSLAAPKDQRTLVILETAKNDRSFRVRHNVHCYKFKADGRMDEFLAWIIRLQEDNSVLDPVPRDEMQRKQDEQTRNLSCIGLTRMIPDWCEERPDDLAAALLQLLDHKSPVVRRGAARLIGVTAEKHDAEEPKPGSQPKPGPEKSKVAPCLEKRKARERLEKLIDSDPDRDVRAVAGIALVQLSRLR
jgi:DNA-binding beta-propeller fold protein YncE